jgi:hypothetical protein
MSSSDEMKRAITHAADQLHLAIEVEAKQHHRGQTIAAMALAEAMLLLLASYLEVSEPWHPETVDETHICCDGAS